VDGVATQQQRQQKQRQRRRKLRVASANALVNVVGECRVLVVAFVHVAHADQDAVSASGWHAGLQPMRVQQMDSMVESQEVEMFCHQQMMAEVMWQRQGHWHEGEMMTDLELGLELELELMQMETAMGWAVAVVVAVVACQRVGACLHPERV